RDERGVPFIRASTLHDAVFAQGFLHAGDRLWQMELARHAVQGRLAEILGAPALGTDRFMRRIGLWRSTGPALDSLSAEERVLAAAYSAGVNARLDTWSGALPPELLALRHEPEPWTPRDILAMGRMMSLTLSSYSEAAAVAGAIRDLGSERARYLFPAYPDWGVETIPPEPAAPPPLAAALMDAYSIAPASNAWVVSGRLTSSGRPLLANDPHLSLQAPNLWYLVGLDVPGPDGVHVVGASIPGAPLVILGHNRAAAWGMTNAYVDDADLFIERLDPTDPTRYLTPDGSRAFDVRVEEIRVRGQDAPDTLVVRRTRHGPVMPLAGEAGDSLLAVRWTALGPATLLRGILELNRASDPESFLRAVDDLAEPHQNFVYADTAGHIGYVMGGTVPIRGDRRPAPVAPVPGWTGEWDWTGTLPFDEHPRSFDPVAGFLVTANNRQTTEPVAELISATWQEPFRALRITEMLEGRGPFSADDMLAMQMDVEDVFARRYRDLAVLAAEDAGASEVRDRLAGWDATASGTSRAAAFFYTWTEVLRRAAARDLYGGDPGYFPRSSLVEVLERRSLAWREDGPGAFNAMSATAMREAVRLVGDGRWRDANRALHEHALGGVRILERILGLNVGPAPHQGSPTTVNVAHYAFRAPADDFPFTTTAGASLRHVVDLGNLDGTGGFVLGTGQSGLPFSPHYDDMEPLWREGGLWTLPVARSAVDDRATDTLILEPLRRE
ncbi:MAG TPA: penicillin acylase family protein, partial [Longimicrobiales bacterium]|nr:penicillin acylase family protein [Longimicrobiales bacterium]